MIDYNKLIQLAEQVKATNDEICIYFSERMYNTHKDEIDQLPYPVKIYSNQSGSFQRDNIYIMS